MAGAWDPPEAGQLIAQSSYSEEEGRTQAEVQLYGESPGPQGRGAVVGKLWARRDLDTDAQSYELQAGRRWRIDARGFAALAGQSSFVVRGGDDTDTRIGAEARLQAGWAWDNGVYLAAEAAALSFDTEVEPRLEATVGRSRRASLLFAQWRYDGDSEGDGRSRAEAGVVWFPRETWGLQVSARAGLGHEETALTVGLWRRPTRR